MAEAWCLLPSKWWIRMDNGSPFSLERFKDNRRKAFFGKCLVVVQAGNDEGEVNIKAKSIGLEDAELKLEIKAK